MLSEMISPKIVQLVREMCASLTQTNAYFRILHSIAGIFCAHLRMAESAGYQLKNLAWVMEAEVGLIYSVFLDKPQGVLGIEHPTRVVSRSLT